MNDSFSTTPRFGPTWSFGVYHTTLAPSVLAGLRVESKRLLEDAERQDYDHMLAGQIRNGQQIKFQGFEELELSRDLCVLGVQYMEEALALKQLPRFRVVLSDCWIVSQRAGDYNPVHRHSESMSGIIYIDVPDCINSKSIDGYLEFIFGRRSEKTLDVMGSRRVMPKAGDVYLFPAWLKHTVYPFAGEGERRSVAFNLDCEWMSK